MLGWKEFIFLDTLSAYFDLKILGVDLRREAESCLSPYAFKSTQKYVDSLVQLGFYNCTLPLYSSYLPQPNFPFREVCSREKIGVCSRLHVTEVAA